jgi:DHA1 family bicyclomycin/chloramphenicol resistance-like MFS transporter
VLLFGLLLYSVFSLLAAFSVTLPNLLGLRVMQGLAGAAGSVIPRSIVRDRHGGAEMAKVMSITFIIFLTVPVLAPSVGQALLLVIPWRGIFFFLALSACAVASWIALRLPETLHPGHRRPLSAGHVAGAALAVLREPTSIFYTLATTALFGALMAYISTMPQIFETAFRRPALMPTVFAIGAGTMAVCSFFNVRIVERVGMRRVSHGALLGFVLFAGAHLAVALSARETLVSFTVLQALTMGCFGLAASNFNAIAMNRMAAIAGSAASVQGVITMVGGAMLGSLIGHQWSGHVVFLPSGSFCCGLLALTSLLIAEKGRLFRKDPVAAAVKID